MDRNKLGVRISEFVTSTPSELIEAVLNELECEDSSPSIILHSRLFTSLQSPEVKSRLVKLINCWKQDCPQVSSKGIALAMRSSLITQVADKSTKIDLVWSGPEIPYPLRRTDQALLELINGAKDRLMVISFAVYKAHEIIDAIENALRRNVKVIICLEDADESEGKIDFSGIKAFRNNIFRLASFYYWPIKNRHKITECKFGSLHAKVAIADRKRAVISSANLTEYAMDVNLELGVYITDTQLAEQIDDMFNDLIIRGIFRKSNF